MSPAVAIQPHDLKCFCACTLSRPLGLEVPGTVAFDTPSTEVDSSPVVSMIKALRLQRAPPQVCAWRGAYWSSSPVSLLSKGWVEPVPRPLLSPPPGPPDSTPYPAPPHRSLLDLVTKLFPICSMKVQNEDQEEAGVWSPHRWLSQANLAKRSKAAYPKPLWNHELWGIKQELSSIMVGC